MDLRKCCLFLPEFPLVLVVFFPHIAARSFTSFLSRLTPSSIEFPALCNIHGALAHHAFLGHTWAAKKLETLLSTLELQAWMTLLKVARHLHAVQEIKGVTLAVAASPDGGSAIYQSVSVLKSQSQGCLYSVFLPPPWVDSTVQKTVNVMIYQTTTDRMSWAHFRFTEIFYVKKNSSVAFVLEEMQNYRIVLTLEDLWAWTKKFNKPDSLYLRGSFCCKRKSETKAEQSKFCTGWCSVQQSEKQRWNDLPVNASIQQSWKSALALVILFCARFLLKAIRRHPSGELRFRVVLGIMKGFVLFTSLVPSHLLLGDCDHGFTAKSELTQITHSLTKGAIFKLDLLSSVCFIFPLAFPIPHHFLLWDLQLNNTGYLNCLLPKENQNLNF